MAPVALAAVWFGGVWFALLTALGAAVIAWEWGQLCHGGRLGPAGMGVVAVVLLAVLLAATGEFLVSLGILVLGTGIVLAAARFGSEREPGLAALGPLWLGVPCVALLWLASDPATGRATVLWIFGVVWATDICAYIAGRSIGGPKLAPRWSPSKTWSGLVGGILGAAAVGAITALIMNAPISALVTVSAALAVVEQFGDLAESIAKRRFGVKDASALIPGHGGLLDRVDGLLAVAPAVALLSLVGGGSVLTWR